MVGPELCLPKSSIPKDWIRTITILAEHASHVRQLQLKIYSDKPSRRGSDYLIESKSLDKMNKQADKILRKVTFPNCTQLKINFRLPIRITVQGHVLPELLAHFSVLEDLILDNYHCPLLSCLSRPDKLKKIELNLFLLPEGYPCQTNGKKAAIVDFSRLKSFTWLLIHPWLEEKILGHHQLSELCRETGVDWLKSFQLHPPARMQYFAIINLAEWSLALLEACCSASASSFRSLTIGYLNPMTPSLLASLQTPSVARLLRSITKLTAMTLRDEETLCKLLSFTPSLSVLELHLGKMMFKLKQPFALQHRLHSLAKLVLIGEYPPHYVMSATWMECVQRNASPAGLQIVKVAELEYMIV